MGKTYCVGDVHGAYKALVQVFEKSNFDYENDKVIFMGDILDGWSEVKECLDFIINIPNKINILGNHDEWAYYYYMRKTHYLFLGDKKFNNWKKHGGLSTINSLGDVGQINEVYLKFISNFKYFHVENNKLFVHAGFNDNLDIKYNHPSALCWDKNFITNVFINKDDKNFKLNSTYDEVYVGHTPTFFINGETTPQNWKNVWDVDTGSAFKGKLSMIDIDSKEVFQSDECYKLYPNEKGRN
jgi:serine/threonine protein phosphatase 1